MDKFKTNVRESFKKAREDNIRILLKLDNLEKENLKLHSKVHELSEKVAVQEVKIKNLEKKK